MCQKQLAKTISQKEGNLDKHRLNGDCNQNAFFQVFATVDKSGEDLVGASVSSHECSGCGSGFSTVADTEPFCPMCGSSSVRSSLVSTARISTNNNLVASYCKSCNTYNGMTKQTAKALAGRMHCVTCSMGLEFKDNPNVAGYDKSTQESNMPMNQNRRNESDLLDGLERNVQYSPIVASLHKELVKATAKIKASAEQEQSLDANQGGYGSAGYGFDAARNEEPAAHDDAEFDSVLKDMEDQVSASQEQTEDDTAADERPEANKTSNQQQLSSTRRTQASTKSKPVKAGANDNTKVDTEPPPNELEINENEKGSGPNGIMGGDARVIAIAEEEINQQMDEPGAEDRAVEVSMISIASLSGHKEFSLSSSGNNVLAFLGPIHIATLTKESAAENASIMHTAPFFDAVAKTVKESSVSAGLESLGFTTVRANFPYVKAARALVARNTKKIQATFDQRTAEFNADMRQGMGIAAAALTKGFFTADENSLKRGFYDALSSTGVRNPERLIDDVFRRYGDQYNQAVIARATDLLSKPLEVRNTIAEAVNASAYIKAEKSDEQLDENADPQQDMDQEVEQTTAGMRPVTARVGGKPAPSKVLSSLSVSSIAETARQRHGSFFATSRPVY